jgi:CubicO group peptidase (beta-lactamase class C family)
MLDDIAHLLARAIADKVTPCAVVEIGTPERPIRTFTAGHVSYAPDAPSATEETIFDLASLTKVLATALLAMQSVETGLLALEDRVADHVAAWNANDRSAVTIQDLLEHCSGLPAHRPYFETLAGEAAIVEAICHEGLESAPRAKAVYSDLGFILLGSILGGTRELPRRVATLLQQMAIVDPLQFVPPPQWRPRLAPTAIDPWRHRLLVGEVDDNNAAALGGCAGHAGLFGTASAVGAVARHLLQVLDGRTGVLQESTLVRCIRASQRVPGSSRALGWDTMRPGSSCGTRMSPRAFGHTGFTGTSLWIDPASRVYVVLLTNRVHPDRADRGIQPLRRAVHDAVMQELQAGAEQ